MDYSKNPPWNEWFDRINGNQNAQNLLIFRMWALAILILQAIFAWCTVCFGLHYSNLSYRRVVTHGPYAFFKHPAYISKLLSFAMLSVPWVDLRGNAGKLRNLRNCVSLLLLVGVYCLRATTEESHLLSVSEDYRKYFASMDGGWGSLAGQVRMTEHGKEL